MINPTKVIRKTDLICDSCGKFKFLVTKGWESAEALKCPDPECGQYHYFVFGKMHCAGYSPKHTEAELKQALGIPAL